MREEKISISPNKANIEIRFELSQFRKTTAIDIEKIVKAEFEAAYQSFIPQMIERIFRIEICRYCGMIIKSNDVLVNNTTARVHKACWEEKRIL